MHPIFIQGTSDLTMHPIFKHQTPPVILKYCIYLYNGPQSEWGNEMGLQPLLPKRVERSSFREATTKFKRRHYTLHCVLSLPLVSSTTSNPAKCEHNHDAATQMSVAAEPQLPRRALLTKHMPSYAARIAGGHHLSH